MSDPLAPVRGILSSLALSLLIWAAIIVLIYLGFGL